ncbi:MAG TPA: penicillin-binding transpeptidase domain-containing protein, partial [Candidatus Paceibacterota bacterium]
QIAFLRLFCAGKLPVSPRSTAIVKKMMLLANADGYRIYGKTGTVTAGTPKIGWLVGFVEKDNHRWYYALTVTGDPSSTALASRPEMVKKALLTLHIIR